MRRVPGSIIVTACGAALLLPMLGSYGLWDPIEIQHADVAQEVSRSGSFKDVTVDGRYSPRPVLYVWLVALGFKLAGVSELGGRLPLALCAVLTLLCVYRAGRRLLSERAGLLGAFVLATTPVFLFQGRQLVSDVPAYFSLACSVGGFAAYLWPADGRRCPFDLVLGALGLVLGCLASGLIAGSLLPLCALVLAVSLGLRTPHSPSPDGVWTAADGTHLTQGTTVRQALASSAKPLALALVAAAALCAILLVTLKSGSYLVLGGAFRRTEMPPTFDTVFRDLGFGFFPWIALVPLALARFVMEQAPLQRWWAPGGAPAPGDGPYRDGQGWTLHASGPSRAAFPGLVLLVVVVAAYLLATLGTVYFGGMRFTALPLLALAVGALLAQLLASGKPVHRLWGIVAAGFVLTLQQDFYMEPQSLAFSHLVNATAKYPPELNIKLVVRLAGVLLALLFFLAAGGTPSEIKPDFKGRYLGAVARGLAWLLDEIGALFRWIGGQGGRRYWYASFLVALAFAGWCALRLTPQLSLHLSNKALFETFHSCRDGDEKLAQYQVAGRGAAYYNKGQVDEVRDQGQLFNVLREPRRWFVLIPATYLASIDQAARQASVAYYVLDDRNSQYLIISNKLAGRCAVDRNPLRRYVLSKPPQVPKPVVASFENKVKLLGYDVPDVVTRGGKFKMTLFFQVLQQMPSGYKLFIHFDQPASRFHGDHDPLGGKFPTQYWLPGDYIVDPHEVEIPIITTPSGVYTIFAGFWLGEGRLKVVDGPNDGANRVQLGTFRVR